MSRPLRIEYAGALYHVTSRGNERKPIYREEVDFCLFLDVLAEVCDRFVADQQQYIEKPVKGKALSEVPHKQKRKPARPLEFYRVSFDSPAEAVCAAYDSGGYTQKAIADYFGLHYSTVSKMVKKVGSCQ